MRQREKERMGEKEAHKEKKIRFPSETDEKQWF